MSNGRRKSRKPQKWEEFGSPCEGPRHPTHQVEQLDASSSKEERKPPSRGDGEMTVLDVLQGLRQGFLSECGPCSIQMKDWQSTIDHIRSHRASYIPDCCSKKTQRTASCIMCPRTFPETGQLVVHVHLEHPCLPKRPYSCHFCGKEFGSYCEAQQHFDIKCVNMKCPVCSAVYNQEYKLYLHLATCLPDFHPHLKSLVCHICWSSIPMSSLAEHMISHSILSNIELTKHKRERQEEERVPELQLAMSEVFLCEVCDKRFRLLDVFRSHLYEHSDASKYCPLCLLKGFSKTGLIVRHLMLRCPKRSQKQLSLASLITTIAKKEKIFFLDVICCLRHDRTLLEAMRTWANVEFVSNFLKSFVAACDEELDSLCRKSHLTNCSTAPQPSDVELLEWLSRYELQLQQGELSLAPDASKDMASWIPPKNVSRAEYDAMLATFYKSINDSRVSGSPTTLTLENTTLNAEVRISAVPPHQNECILESTKKESPPPLPSREFIRKHYPGVVTFPEVDLESLRRVAEEAKREKRRDWVKESISSGHFSRDLVERLELEGQYLRELEPFYVVSKPAIEFSALREGNRVLGDRPISPDPELVQSLLDQAKELMTHVNYYCQDF